MTGDVFWGVVRNGKLCESASYGLGMHVVDDHGKHYISGLVDGRHLWVEQSPYDSMVLELRALHKPTDHVFAGKTWKVCEHCAALCHDRGGLRCEVMTPDGMWPCETIAVVDRFFPSVTT